MISKFFTPALAGKTLNRLSKFNFSSSVTINLEDYATIRLDGAKLPT